MIAKRGLCQRSRPVQDADRREIDAPLATIVIHYAVPTVPQTPAMPAR